MAQFDIKKKVTCAFGLKAPSILALVLEGKGRVYSGRLVGIASGTKTGVTEYGEWTALIGQFAFTDRFGTVVRAVQAFGPDLVILPAAAALDAGASAVNVAVDVYAVADDKSPVGWSYVAQSAIDADETDPLAMLINKANTVPMPALMAPQASVAKTVKK